MGLVICDMSISLDGYVTGPGASRENPFGDGAGGLHDWMFSDPSSGEELPFRGVFTMPSTVSVNDRSSDRRCRCAPLHNGGSAGYRNGGLPVALSKRFSDRDSDGITGAPPERL